MIISSVASPESKYELCRSLFALKTDQLCLKKKKKLDSAGAVLVL